MFSRLPCCLVQMVHSRYKGLVRFVKKYKKQAEYELLNKVNIDYQVVKCSIVVQVVRVVRGAGS